MEFTWRDYLLCVLAILVGLMFLENSQLKVALRGEQVAYTNFLAIKLKGRPISEVVRQDKLALLSLDQDNAVVCGLVRVEAARAGDSAQHLHQPRPQ